MLRHALLGAASCTMLCAQAINAQDQPTQTQNSAEQDRRVLMPDDILSSSAQRFPDILASIEREAIARGAELTAQGAFDLILSAEGFSRITGFYSGTVVETKAKRRLRN